MEPVIERDTLCFCCGADNERGLHLAVTYPAPGQAESSLVIPAWFTGWRNMTHGGLLATLLDEIMAHACVGIARRAVTAEITVRYQKPVETGTVLRAVGRVDETRGRILRTKGWLYDADGAVVAEGSARFVAPAAGAAPAAS
jgi:uncharacterized protein (TIGR00369 family)